MNGALSFCKFGSQPLASAKQASYSREYSIETHKIRFVCG
jgi:hypothetical protein